MPRHYANVVKDLSAIARTRQPHLHDHTADQRAEHVAVLGNESDRHVWQELFTFWCVTTSMIKFVVDGIWGFLELYLRGGGNVKVHLGSCCLGLTCSLPGSLIGAMPNHKCYGDVFCSRFIISTRLYN